jgi:tripartite-type tricarboxylate transporter receptor subunit TctC
MFHDIKRAGALALILLCVPAVAAAAETASNYPTRPVRFIIAQTTGTSVDTLARILAIKMGDLLGQQFVADNRAGAGGTIGGEIAAHAAPDGYTLLVSSTGMQVISPQIYKKLNYEPVGDFQPISSSRSHKIFSC